MQDPQYSAIAILAGVAIVLLSVMMQRRPRVPGRPRWVPWNGLLFAGILIVAFAIAHLFGVERQGT